MSGLPEFCPRCGKYTLLDGDCSNVTCEPSCPLPQQSQSNPHKVMACPQCNGDGIWSSGCGNIIDRECDLCGGDPRIYKEGRGFVQLESASFVLNYLALRLKEALAKLEEREK